MTAKRNYILMMAIVLIGLCGAGCKDEEVVRQVALQLHASVLEDEKLIDEKITAEVRFYEAQQKTIENARSQSMRFNVDAFRRMRSAQAATSMSLQPDKEARLARLIDYLHETHDKEFALWQELYGGDQKAREELRSKIAKLERQKKVLKQVKDNLNQLAIAPSSKKRAQTLLKFSQDLYAAFKQTSQ